MALLVDPLRFQAEGALVNWALVARRLGLSPLLEGSRLAATLQLRWILRADLGLPTEPFIVWRRHKAQEKPVDFQIDSLLFLFGYDRVTWGGGVFARVSADISTPSGGTVLAYVGAPTMANVVDHLTVGPGAATVQLSAPAIDGLLISSTISLTGLRGIASGALAAASGWQRVELVGLPVKKSAWAGIGAHGSDQGLVSALTDAQTAAIQRLTRGAPPFGWAAHLAPAVPAPLWEAPNFPALVQEVNTGLLDALRGIASGFAPNVQSQQTVGVFLPPPANSSGTQMSGPGSTSQISPLGMMLVSAGSETFASLALGYGTAYPVTPEVIGRDGAFDWMITARWEKGLNGSSAPFELAAIVPTPGTIAAPPPPANLGTTLMGYLRPPAPDGDWRTSIRTWWDKPPKMNLIRARSFALARAGVTPAEAPRALLTRRASGGFAPILVNDKQTTPPDPEFARVHGVDRELPIPSNPGARTLKYAAATQDLYGQWSPWVAADHTVVQPDPEKVRIVGAELKPALPATVAGCPTTLTIEFLWDWSVRRPKNVRFVGSLYAAAFHGAPPPAMAVPSGLTRSLGGGGGALEVSFSGDTASAPGAIILALNEAGDQQVGFGPAQGSETRRYRITLPGFLLDFGVSGHIGLALWARAQERIAPERVGPWGDQPSVIATSDPRPPVVVVEQVDLASLPDAAGEAHARLAWAAVPGVAGYFIYESTETKILLANGLAEPTPDLTLTERLAAVKAAFRNRPSRREFTRRNATLLTGSSLDVTLPRGSTAIHAFVVLGQSAGQVEGDWPSGPDADDALIAVVSPRLRPPSAPTLEVQRVADTTVSPPVLRARLAVATRPGVPVSRVDLHRVRVDDAARELDTMGPPLLTLAASGAGWMVAMGPSAGGTSTIKTIIGFDSPPGSWKRVWYRAAAWSERDPARGLLPDRSPASNAVWVVIPPESAPEVSPITLQAAGADPADVLLLWTSAAPVKKTVVGPHTITVSARTVGALEGIDPVISVEKPLHLLAIAAPATGSDVWRASAGPGPVAYRALIRRISADQAVKVAVRITDPLGRTGEQTIVIPAGSINPPPEISPLSVNSFGVPVAGVVAAFASSAPLNASGGSYRVRVTVLRRPQPSPFPIIRPILVVDLPVEDVPVASGIPPGPDPLVLRRAGGGGGPPFQYAAFCRVTVLSFTVRITAPDGRFVEQTHAVP